MGLRRRGHRGRPVPDHLRSGKGTDRRNRLYLPATGRRTGPVKAEATPSSCSTRSTRSTTFVGNDGPIFWFFTDKDAPRGRVVAIDTRKPGAPSWKTLIAEADDTHRVGERSSATSFLVDYLQDAREPVARLRLSTGKPLARGRPAGPRHDVGLRRRPRATETFYAFTSFNYPTTIYRYDLATGPERAVPRAEVDFDPDDVRDRAGLLHEQGRDPRPDVPRAPQGRAADGRRPTLLYGYGGFNISLTPDVPASPNLVWMEMGGVYAVANLRGGGEYGKAWHEAGTKLQASRTCSTTSSPRRSG